MRPNSVSSLIKKKEMKMTEKSPTASPATAEATEPRMLEMFDRSSTSEIFWMISWTPSKSSPTQGITRMIQPLTKYMMFWLSKFSCAFREEASRTIFVTTGITCTTTRISIAKMKTRVIIASSASGADFPLILIFRSNRNKG